jgi:uridine kinase
MSTGAVSCFALSAYQGGIVLHFPRFGGTEPVIGRPQPKLFSTFRETAKWNAVVGCENIAQLNKHCMTGSISRLIKVAEALHERKIVDIADQILTGPDARLVLIAGPSASGKTTFSKRLEIQLQVSGVQPVTLSVDNYYVDRRRTPKNPDGTYNFEAVEAIDLDLLGDQIRQLLSGKRVETPVFNFESGRRLKNRTVPMQLAENGVLIMEGIHSLNERLTQGVPRRRKFKIFVSALTQLAIDEHNRIFTSDARLIRRLVRDRLYRGYTAGQTIAGWTSVRAGEEELIFPFQEEADVRFNSALVYEQAVLKPYAERFLMEVPRGGEAFPEATRLYQFLQYFIPILPEEVPHTSVLREFIGGSTFHY